MEKYIFAVPSFGGGMLFTREVLTFLAVILLFIIGMSIALAGFRCLKTMLFLLMGVAGGAVGYIIAEKLTEQPEIRLIFFVVFCVVGWVFLAAISSFMAYLSKRARFYNFFQAVTPYFTALLGTVIVFFVVYDHVYRDLAVVGGACLGLLAIGCLLGALRYRKKRGFYTYEDLLRRPVGENKTNA
jgi:hypothetical protein